MQVAVDHEHQVVQVLAGRQADGAQRLHLVHFAVATKHPDLAVFGVGDAAGVQVLEEARLVDRHQRAQAHRHGGELPELGHQLGMGVAGQTLAVHLLAEVQQLFFSQAPLQVGAGIDARGYMALDVDAVAAVVFALGMPEMVEAGAKHVGQRRKRADMAAQIAAVNRMMTVGLDHHGHRVPAHVGPQPPFDLEVTGAMRLLVDFNGVDVAGVGRERHVDAALARVLEQLLQEKVRALRALALDHGGQGVHPFAGFLAVRVFGGRTEQVLGCC